MSDSPNPQPARPGNDKEYEDPHFHDDDLDIQDDESRSGNRGSAKKTKPARRLPPPPRRRHED
jgi:hypothetical protein